MKKDEYIAKYGEEAWEKKKAYVREYGKNWRRGIKKTATTSAPCEYNRLLMVEKRKGPLPRTTENINTQAFVDERKSILNPLLGRWQRHLTAEWKRRWGTQTIITIERANCPKHTALVFECYCLRWTDEQREWFKNEVDKIDLTEIERI